MAKKVKHTLDWDGSGAFVAKIVFDSELSEYTVKLYVNGTHRTQADYFTNDKKDALGTAFLELERMSKKG